VVVLCLGVLECFGVLWCLGCLGVTVKGLGLRGSAWSCWHLANGNKRPRLFTHFIFKNFVARGSQGFVTLYAKVHEMWHYV